MKRKLFYGVLPLMLATLVFAGCSNSSDSGTAARSQVTTGVITGFGSVFVNGVEFTKKASVPDTQVATFQFDGTAHPQSDLKIGMIVKVRGSVDTATKTGEFESIEFSPELRGPVGAATDVLISGTTGTLKVMGHDVVTSATTSFEGVTDLTALKSKITSTIHPELEVSGRMDNAGKFHATRIAVKTGNFGGSGKCEIHGKIASAATSTTDGQSFAMGDIQVVTTATTSMPNMTAADLVAGASVEVKGNCDVNTNTLTATRIEGNKGHHGLGEGVEVEDNVSIQGIAAGSLSGGSFELNGPDGAVTINCDSATVFGGGTGDSSIIAANATLEVEGTVQADGSVLATKVKSESEIESESHGGTDDSSGGGGGDGSGGGTHT